MTSTTTRRSMLLATAATAATLAAPRIAGAQAAETVRLLNIETNRDVLAIWNRTVASFEAKTPNVKVEMRTLETEAFKTRLPTILQSDTRPHIFYSWGGGLVKTQADAGMLEDISKQMDPSVSAKMAKAALAQFAHGDKLYGLPYNTAEVGLLINRDLFAKAGVTPDDVMTWPGLLASIEKFKKVGIQPLVGGGQDKWQMMLLYGAINLRLGGQSAIAAATAGRDGGFENPVFVRGGELYKQLCDLNPYQDGFMAMKAQTAAGMFADGKAAILMHGTLFVRQNPSFAADKKGLSADTMGFIGFPAIPAGRGTARETQVNINGWLVSKGAPKIAIEFLQHFLNVETQGELAAGGYVVPANLDARERLSHPIMKQAANSIASMDFLQTVYNTLLGPSAGKTSDDVAVGIAAGKLSPQDAAKLLEAARVQDTKAN